MENLCVACVQVKGPKIRPKKNRTSTRHPPDSPRTPAPGIPAECRARDKSGAERSAADTPQNITRTACVGRCGLHMIRHPCHHTKRPHRASHAVKKRCSRSQAPFLPLLHPGRAKKTPQSNSPPGTNQTRRTNKLPSPNIQIANKLHSQQIKITSSKASQSRPLRGRAQQINNSGSK